MMGVQLLKESLADGEAEGARDEEEEEEEDGDVEGGGRRWNMATATSSEVRLSPLLRPFLGYCWVVVDSIVRVRVVVSFRHQFQYYVLLPHQHHGCDFGPLHYDSGGGGGSYLMVFPHVVMYYDGPVVEGFPTIHQYWTR